MDSSQVVDSGACNSAQHYIIAYFSEASINAECLLCMHESLDTITNISSEDVQNATAISA
eukprot:scaffold102462_cov26-Prasinocladus_malaysianus.AAC.1